VGLGSCPIPVGEWRLGWKGESQLDPLFPSSSLR
jgi:hypothetical protein